MYLVGIAIDMSADGVIQDGIQNNMGIIGLDMVQKFLIAVINQIQNLFLMIRIMIIFILFLM